MVMVNNNSDMAADMTYTYDTLHGWLRVADAAEALNYNGALDFDDGGDADCEYQYDSGGALTYDGNRGITSITYDYGHHPSSIVMSIKKRGVYNDYTPDGRKLSDVVKPLAISYARYYSEFFTNLYP